MHDFAGGRTINPLNPTRPRRSETKYWRWQTLMNIFL